jgi:hypothetical protein
VGEGIGDNMGEDVGVEMREGIGIDMCGDVGDDVGLDAGDNMDDSAGEDVGTNEIPSTSSKAGISDHFVPGTSLIPKPPGEAGRPQSGGFNLETSLAWPKPTYQKIVVSLSTHTALQISSLMTEIHSIASIPRA